MNKGVRNTLLGIAAFISVIMAMFLYTFFSVRTMTDEQYQELGYYRYENARPLKDFSLVNNAAEAVSLKDLKGEWSLLFFGFTFCPDICPTTMGVLNRAVERMQTATPKVILVSVDPERDNPEQMDAYVKSFNPAFIGYTGEFDDIVGLATQLNIAFGKVPGPTPGSYLVDHSASIVVLNPEGEYTGFIKAPHDPIRIATILDSLQ